MGLFSGGNSKSSTTVKNTTMNAGFSEVAGNAIAESVTVDGKLNTVNVLDGGAIAESFALGNRAVEFAETTSAANTKLVSDVAETAGRQTREAVDAVSQSVRTGAENIINQLGTYGAVIAGGYLLVKLFRG